MVYIYTGIEKLDELLKQKLNENKIDAEIVFYSDYLLNEKNKDKFDTIILVPQKDTKMPFKDFLFALRQKDKRIVLLLGNEQSEHLGYALALGIYDIVFDPVTPEKILHVVKNPAKFSNVQGLFLGLKGKVSFSGEILEDENKDLKTPNNKTEIETEKEKNDEKNRQAAFNISPILPEKIQEMDKNTEETALEQIRGIMQFLGYKTAQRDINKALVELENVIIKEFI